MNLYLDLNLNSLCLVVVVESGGGEAAAKAQRRLLIAVVLLPIIIIIIIKPSTLLLQIVVGLGHPIEGTGAMEALAHGCVFFNPKYIGTDQNIFKNIGKPTHRLVFIYVSISVPD